jgi:hypothetical protein
MATARAPHRQFLRLTTAFLLGCSGSNGTGVVPPPPSSTVARIELNPGAATLSIGETLQLTGVARDASGRSLTQSNLTWTASNVNIATVSATGLVAAVSPGTTMITASVEGVTATAGITVNARFDVDALGVPRIVTADYIELSKIARISRFRSAIGHDYGDDTEQCRSMKHYFQPFANVDWASVVVRSPLQGTVVSILDEQTFGKQVRIASTHNAAATVYLFHVRTDPAIAMGTTVAAGDRLGTHIGNATMSDIAVWFDTPRGRRLVSYFDAMTDDVFATYLQRGVASRVAPIISAAERNSSPLTCNGEAFAGTGALTNWIDLTTPP